ncbi:hypothetical protein, partial [Rhizobium ruizarguesonis]|uniref:hypothetical protein n=1 Tax=Rhizobium ruizarguesonis TaxID=2081791 RepID=UPI0019547CCF
MLASSPAWRLNQFDTDLKTLIDSIRREIALEGVPAIHDHFELWPSPTEIARSNILGLKQTFSALDKYYIVS